MSDKTTQETVNEIQAQVGATLKVRDANWVKLMQEGVIINLHIRRWRAETQLKQTDLGINLDKKSADLLMRLGSKALMPSEYIQEAKSIDSGARSWLASKTIKTHYGQFCPVTAYQDIREGLGNFTDRYNTLRGKIYNDYDEWVTRIIRKYQGLFASAYDQLETLGSAPRMSRSSWIAQMVSAIEKLIPDRQTIYDSMAFEVELSYIPLPSLLAQDEVEARRIRTDGVMDEQRRSLMEQMNQDVVASARQQKEGLVNDFMQNVVTTLRNMVFDTCDDVLTSIKKNGKIQPRSALQIKNLVTQIENLNFYDDQQVTRMVETIKAQLTAYNGTEKSLDSIKSKLTDIAIIARGELASLGSAPRACRTIGLDTVPTEAGIAQARKRTGLDKPITTQPEIEGLEVVRGKRKL